MIVATERPAAARILPAPLPTPDAHTSSSTWYFSAPPPAVGKYIILNSYPQESEGVFYEVGSEGYLASPRLACVAYPSEVQPSYAPAGRALAMALVIGKGHQDADEEWVRKQLLALGASDAAQWRHLKTYTPTPLPPREIGRASCRERV